MEGAETRRQGIGEVMAAAVRALRKVGIGGAREERRREANGRRAGEVVGAEMAAAMAMAFSLLSLTLSVSFFL